MRQRLLSLSMFLLWFVASPLWASTQYITFSQAVPGTVVATLDISTTQCSINPGGNSVVTQTTNQFNLDSGLVVPPPGCNSSATIFYQLTASLGPVSTGQYNVVWTGGGYQIVLAQASFNVVNGILQGPPQVVPTLDGLGLTFLVLWLAGITVGLKLLKRREP